MFLILYIIKLFAGRFANCENIETWMLVVTTVILLVSKIIIRQCCSLCLWPDVLCVHSTFYYFQFFVLGYLLYKYEPLFNLCFCNSFITSFFVIIYLCASIFILHPKSGLVGMIYKLIVNYSGLFVVFQFFRTYHDRFHAGTILGRCLQYIGKRTLAIYLIHYFLISTFITGSDLIANTNSIVMLFLNIACSLIISFVCCIICDVLCLNPYVAQWLLGVKSTRRLCK